MIDIKLPADMDPAELNRCSEVCTVNGAEVQCELHAGHEGSHYRLFARGKDRLAVAWTNFERRLRNFGRAA